MEYNNHIYSNAAEQIQDIQNQYYSTSGKNLFFKKNQKFECAQTVASKMNIYNLFDHTFRILPSTNKLYCDYPMFKTYMSPELFSMAISRSIDLCTFCVQSYGAFEIHVNIDSFTVTAAERYKTFIINFCDECARLNTGFSDYVITFNIYNIPITIDQISKLIVGLLPVEIKPKIKLYNKKESEVLLQNLLNG